MSMNKTKHIIKNKTYGFRLSLHKEEVHSKTKHMNLDYHSIREKVLANEIAVQYVPFSEQKIYIFTKAYPIP